VAVRPKDGDGAGEEHRTEVPYQVTRWSNTYSGAGGGMSSQWNWDDRPRSRGCTWVYEIVGKLKCPKADTPASGRLRSKAEGGGYKNRILIVRSRCDYY